MSAPEQIKSLIERFNRNRETYLSGKYNETQIRREFIDPFFIALGWDVNNTKGYAEAGQDKMVGLVEGMLGLHKKLAGAKTAHEKTMIQRQIDATDKQIDRLVYALYDLTEEEIKIVEENIK